MSNHKSPLRERPLSNSPDPVKSSIIRDSGMGWVSPTSNNMGSQSSGSSGSMTSPLRISKRESPRLLPQPPIARRSSSSYRHVRNNNLVSKSPFKSQIPSLTPSNRPPILFPISRRVSGEKRPRPSSIHDQAESENDRPFALKRERRQSKTYQGLIQKEPVTKSPFKQRPLLLENQPSPVPPPPLTRPLPRTVTPAKTQPIPSLGPPPIATSISSPSPGRSSLVSRRMHGPRLSSGSRSKKKRRKTVTWDERCDVVEFHKEEDETDEEFFSSAEEGEEIHPVLEQDIEDNLFFHLDQNAHTSVPKEESSYGSVELSDVSGDNEPLLGMALDPDASISGLVDEIFASSSAPAEDDLSPRHDDCASVVTPPRHSSCPPDLDMEDGVPLGRSHHAARFLQRRREYSQSPKPSPPRFSPYTSAHSSPHQGGILGIPAEALPVSLSTPPRRSAAPSPDIITLQPSIDILVPPSRAASPPLISRQPSLGADTTHMTTPPLGRSTHAERLRMAREEDCDDVLMLPGTPSPCKSAKKPVVDADQGDGLVPIFRLELQSSGISPASDEDPFAVQPSNNEESNQEESWMSESTHITSDEPPGIDTRGDNYVETEETSDQLSQYDNQSRLNILEIESSEDLTGTFLSKPYHQPDGSEDEQELSTEGSIERPRISEQEVKRRVLKRRSGHNSNDGSLSSSPAIPPIDQDMRIEPLQIADSSLDKDAVSVTTVVTDISTETATIERAERKTPVGASIVDVKEFGLLRTGDSLRFDFGSNFGRSLGLKAMDDGLQETTTDNFSAPGRASTEEMTSIPSNNVKMEGVDVDMRSALDRLMDDVAGAKVDGSIAAEESSCDISNSLSSDPQVKEGVALDPTLLHHRGYVSRHVSVASAESIPPPVPPKDNIRAREQMVLEKRRETRQMEEDEFSHYLPSYARAKTSQELLGVGRPSRRRSMSTGDIVLSIRGVEDAGDGQLGDSIEKELEKLVEIPRKQKYLVREHRDTIYASSSDPDIVSHMAGPGDVNVGKAWRSVRRPSDMNEYSKQIKELRAQEKSGKAYGKVFVKVMGVKGIHVTLPRQPTILTCTLNNGIHFVSTPECLLSQDFRIDQEFELIEHNKLEFTLTLKVRRDPHIISQFKALVPPPPIVTAPPPVTQSSSKSGMLSFFSSPKKSKEKLPVAIIPPPRPAHHIPENLARHLKPDGTLARAFISFKDIASRCDARLFETSYPLIGQRAELGGKFSTLQIGEIVLQMFRLPPLSGLSPEQLPQSLEECHRGLRHVNWHKVTYFEGILTQCGGDCNTWRRRQFRVIGANLVAFNDVTKKATAAIDLKKAIAIEDTEARNKSLSPSSATRHDEYDNLYGVERSFRLIFPLRQEILFFADTDDEKARWLDVLRALVGHIPPHPIWAELLWQRYEDLKAPHPPTRPPAQSSPSWLIKKGPHQ